MNISTQATEDYKLDFTHDLYYDQNTSCPLCGRESESLVNCGAHEWEFSERSKLLDSRAELSAIIGGSADNAFNPDERDCLICSDCRSSYYELAPFCPLYILFRGIHSFLDEQKEMHGRKRSGSMALILRQTESDREPLQSTLHRLKILSSMSEAA